MIIGIGTDIVELKLTLELGWDSNEKIQKRIFSLRELKEYQKSKKANYLMGRFAAKEAVLKCIGTGMIDGISLNSIEILSGRSGKPYIVLNGKAAEHAKNISINRWHISISHTSKYSQAFAIAEQI